MLVDAPNAEPPSRGEFDVCIAGGGVAGITLALALGGVGRRVALLEAGGLANETASQELYDAPQDGFENLPLSATRVRAFGGSSHHWGGWLRVFDPHDFAREPFQAGSSWPIAAADLAPYLDIAKQVLGTSRRSGGDRPLPRAGGRLQELEMSFSAPPANLGSRYRGAIDGASNVVAVLGAPVTEVILAEASPTVAGFVTRDPASGRTLSWRARTSVLAMGAIENCRALLAWNRRHGEALGNSSDLVGRYYMQHLHQRLGVLVPLAEIAARQVADGRTYFPLIAPSKAHLSETGHGSYRLYARDLRCPPYAEDRAGEPLGADCAVTASPAEVVVTAEQAPDPDSRVRLSEQTDALGMAKPILTWRVGRRDHETLRHAAEDFARFLIDADIGRMRIDRRILDMDAPADGWTSLQGAMGAAGHQLGGTRMGASAATGVVDADCRVWGTNNLFVAGSSVFRTSGHATPTLTIVQLALRLADRLDRLLGAG
jgi:choline dehydrogenase-like flavoprotein